MNKLKEPGNPAFFSVLATIGITCLRIRISALHLDGYPKKHPEHAVASRLSTIRQFPS